MNPGPAADLPAAAWRKSTRSTGGGSNCVEVACLPSHIAIRDSKHPEGGTLIVTTAAFRELTGDIRRDTFGG
jgi:Domain of unknown function (DUF397)